MPKLLLVCSLKGGVGKTTVAVGLAKALCRRGHEVGILDIDYRTPGVPFVFGGDAVTARLGRAPGDLLVPPRIDGIWIMSMAYFWSPESVVEVPDEEALEDVKHLLGPDVIAWDPEYIVVDTPPTATGMIRAAIEAPNVMGAVVVAQPAAVAVSNTRRTFDMLREHQVPIIGLVSNMGTDGNGRRLFDLGDEDLQRLADSYGIPAFFALPHILDAAIRGRAFDRLLDLVLATHPLVLPRRESTGREWQSLLDLARRLKH